MLRLTDQAASMITELIDDADLPDSAGLRIHQRDDHTSLAMDLADEPAPDDVVVLVHDAAVFLAPLAAARVDEQVLDARSGETGSAFYLRDDVTD